MDKDSGSAGKYDDIINTQYPLPSNRQPMSLKERAKIFLPFAALKGYEEALEKVRKEVEEEMDSNH